MVEGKVKRLSHPVRGLRRGMALLAGLALACSSALAADQSAASGASACCGPISPAGQTMAKFLDDSGVDHLWLARQHVHWESGVQDRPADYSGPGRATHCSAYAAAMGKRLGIYMLRPPEHSTQLLASAQTRWFASDQAKQQGWEAIANAQAAQSRANAGALVVISYANPNSHKPGHIAIVRPSLKTQEQLAAEGPQTAQAGNTNSANWTALQGFSHHPGAWPHGVKYFGHALPAQ